MTEDFQAAGRCLIEKAEWLSAEFSGRAAHYDRSGEFPVENIAALNAAGLLALPVRRAVGGAGQGLATAQAVVGAVARGDASTALILTMHYMQHAAIARRDNWPEPLAARVEREAVDGPALINALLAEPEVGSITRGGLPGTVARKVAGGWRVTGRKSYATGIPGLSWLLVLVRLETARLETSRLETGGETWVGSLLIPNGSDGLHVLESWDHVGMRATHSHDVVFEDVFVPDELLISQRSPDSPTGSAPDRGSVTMLWYTGLAAAIYDGIARAARDWLLSFLNQRVPANLGAPLATVPRLQEAVGAIEMLLGTNAVLMRSFAAQVDAGGEPAALSAAGSLMKHVVVENAVDITTRALDLAGNHGLSRRNPLERHHRDALCGRIQAPQNDLLRVAAGRAALASAQAGAAARAGGGTGSPA